jgi:hypothetical protein
MLNFIITSAKYFEFYNGNLFIQSTINGEEMSVPVDWDNRHYAEIMRQVEAGTLVVAPA